MKLSESIWKLKLLLLSSTEYEVMGWEINGVEALKFKLLYYLLSML